MDFYNDTKCENISFGTFQTMKLEKKLLQNVKYTNTTPIQRKIIPLLLQGSNVTGIARTGSGKTFAYLVPIINNILKENEEKEAFTFSNEANLIKFHTVILVPTRELAHQVLKVAIGLTKSTNIKILAITGGVSIFKNFSSLENDYNILIATVGRLRHVLDESKSTISTKFLVIDELDRIFEEKKMYDDLDDLLGLSEDISPKLEHKIISMFSATLPNNIIPFIGETTLVKIDNKMSKNLKNYFFYINKTDKEKGIIALLNEIKHKNNISGSAGGLSSKKIVIFVATRYTVEYIADILNRFHYTNTILYSSLDHEARVQSMKKFTSKLNILICTDIASRGMDIRNLDICINYDLTDEKTFLHRVGRVARKGLGNSFSFITKENLNFFSEIKSIEDKSTNKFILERVPQDVIDNIKLTFDENLKFSAVNGEKKWKSFQKVHGSYVDLSNIMISDFFTRIENASLKERDNILGRIKNYKPTDIPNKSNYSISSNIQKTENDLIYISGKGIQSFENKTEKESIKHDESIITKEENLITNNNKINEDKSDSKKENNENQEKEFKDQFYIPYKNQNSKNSIIHHTHSIAKDEIIHKKNIKRKNDKNYFNEWKRRKNTKIEYRRNNAANK